MYPLQQHFFAGAVALLSPSRKPLASADSNSYYAQLNDARKRFVDEYLVDLNAWQAAIRAGYAPTTSSTLLEDTNVRQAIEERRAQFDEERASSHSGARFVLGKLWDVATADPRELVEIRRVPCRYCHGTNGQYQFTKTEMDRLLKAHDYGMSHRPLEAIWPRGGAEQSAYVAGSAGLPFDPQGGDGYTTNAEPNTECSECGGRGIVLHLVADTRGLSPQARQLYRGVKYDQRGRYEVLMANQDHATHMLAKHYNVGIERKELLVRQFDPRQLDDDELHAAIAELEAMTLGRSEYAVVSTQQDTRTDGVRIARQERQRSGRLGGYERQPTVARANARKKLSRPK